MSSIDGLHIYLSIHWHLSAHSWFFHRFVSLSLTVHLLCLIFHLFVFWSSYFFWHVFSLNRVARNPWKNPSVAWSMYKKALDRKFRSNKTEQGIALRKPNNSKLLLMDILHNTFKAWKQSANLNNCFSLLCIVKRETILSHRSHDIY